MTKSGVFAKGVVIAGLALWSTGAQAVRVESDNPEVPTVEAILSTAAQPSKSRVPLRPLTNRKRRPQDASTLDRSGKTPSVKQHGSLPSSAAGKGKDSGSPDADLTLRGRKITVLANDAGVEFFCRHHRKRLWVQERGWVVRAVRSCF